ncbi:MAG: hypothetical protein R3Y26_05830 [Rikenellaceae bacterium]
MKTKKLTLLLTGIFMLNVASIYGQNTIEQDKHTVTFLVDDNEQKGVLLKFNEDFFITSIKTISNIDKSIINTIVMFDPSSKQFKDAVSSVDSKEVTLIGYFEITSKDSSDIPDEFKVADKNSK